MKMDHVHFSTPERRLVFLETPQGLARGQYIFQQENVVLQKDESPNDLLPLEVLDDIVNGRVAYVRLRRRAPSRGGTFAAPIRRHALTAFTSLRFFNLEIYACVIFHAV